MAKIEFKGDKSYCTIDILTLITKKLQDDQIVVVDQKKKCFTIMTIKKAKNFFEKTIDNSIKNLKNSYEIPGREFIIFDKGKGFKGGYFVCGPGYKKVVKIINDLDKKHRKKSLKDDSDSSDSE